MLLLLTERNLGVKVHRLFSDKENGLLSAKRMVYKLPAEEACPVAAAGHTVLARRAGDGGGTDTLACLGGNVWTSLQARRFFRTTSSPATSSASCSCSVRDTTQVREG